MKRFIALLLALVLALGLVPTAFAADLPAELVASPEDAFVVVYSSAAPDTKYYFSTLDTKLFNWACGLEGDTIVQLIRDLEMESSSNSSNYLYIPMVNANWYNSAPLEKNLIIDLGGFTLSYEGNQNLFFIQRYGCTIRNGTIDYTCIGKTRNPFCFGLSNGQTATTKADKRFDPILNLENVHVYNNTPEGGCIASNYIHGTTINVKNSVLWNQKWATINLTKTSQTNLPNGVLGPWEGSCELTVNIEGSIIGSGTAYPVSTASPVDPAVDTVKINVKDSTLVTNTEAGLICNPILDKSYNTNGQEAVVNEDWSLFLHNGTTAAGKAYVFGNGGIKDVLPFTDVKTSDWFYSFVHNLYFAKVISGMTETTYAPNGTLTYGQALKLITLAVDEPAQAPVDSHWASGYVNFALDRGWLYNEVSPDASITREAFCQIAAAAAGITEQPASNPFTDTADTSVLALYNAGIINGMSDTTFQPNGLLTRAQIAKIIYGIITR